MIYNTYTYLIFVYGDKNINNRDKHISWRFQKERSFLAQPFLKVGLAQPFLKVDLVQPFLKVEVKCLQM